MNIQPVIVLLTDFGLADSFVGVMKGVICGIAPFARILDLSHDIPPFDIRSAGRMLEDSFRYFPEGSIIVCVVDPGVGSSRRAILCKSQNRFFLAPDNGLLSQFFTEDAEIYSLQNPAYFLPDPSSTFHGRDIFAPVSAHLAQGVLPENFGEKISPELLIRLPEMPCECDEKGVWHGEIIAIDRFGNALTSLSAKKIGIKPPLSEKERMNWKFLVGWTSISALSQTYSDVSEGQALAYIGSGGHIELGVRNGNFQLTAGISVGSGVQAWQKVGKN